MASKVRAKFQCSGVEKVVGWNGHQFLWNAKFHAVGFKPGDPTENEKFFAASPSGSLQVSSILSDAFEPGKAYYLDITPADE